MQTIRESIRNEEERASQAINRKRKSPLDDDQEFGSVTAPQRGKHLNDNDDAEVDTYEPSCDDVDTPPPMLVVVEPEDGSSDEDEDSDEYEEDDEEDSNVDINKFLESNENLPDLYGELGYDQQLAGLSSADINSTVNGFADTHTSGDHLFSPTSTSWSQQSDSMVNTSHPWATHRYNDSEADVAVESILSQDEDDEAQITADLSAIASNLEEQFGGGRGGVSVENDDDDDEDETDDDDDEEDEEDDSQQSQPEHTFIVGQHESCMQMEQMEQQQAEQPIDEQMQSAIDSILTDLPSHTPVASYYNAANNYGASNRYMMSNMQGMHRAGGSGMAPSFLNTQTNVSDPMLDEAVKSILS